MHSPNIQPGSFDAERELILTRQTPGEIVFLSAADTDLTVVGRVWANHFGARLRVAHAAPLRQPVAADDYIDNVLRHARLVIARLLGGEAYFPHLLQALRDLRDESPRPRLLLLPGTDAWDEALATLSDFPPEIGERMFHFFREGGADNILRAAQAVDVLLENGAGPLPEPIPMPEFGLYRQPRKGRGYRAWLCFYRAWHQAGDTAVVDALQAALETAGFEVLCHFSYSLRSPDVQEDLAAHAAQAAPDVILTLQGFSACLNEANRVSVFEQIDCPVLQVPVSASPCATWLRNPAGLPPAEVAMNVALPEIDGRVLGTVPGFKEDDQALPLSEYTIKRLKPEPEQVRFIAEQAASWARLRHKPPIEKRIAIVLSNYPNRDGRIGNGVGLDTPASLLMLLEALQTHGYQAGRFPGSSDELMQALRAGVTNDPERSVGKPVSQHLSGARLREFIASLPEARRDQLRQHWPDDVPSEVPVAGLQLGNVFIGIQPARGFGNQTQAIYHSPDLPPPPAYFAFYLWIREEFRADAVVHLGKHGNLEWLPGRSVGLGPDDYPRLCLGALPNVYPFIVNNPGEGAQAKRRSAAVIVDHLTPPLVRAGLYAELEKMERLLEEHAHSTSLYPARAAEIEGEIKQLLVTMPWREELPEAGSSIQALGNYLCEIKESQIRSGLHVLGAPPAGEEEIDVLLSLLRVPWPATAAAGRDGDGDGGGIGAGLLDLLSDAPARVDDLAPAARDRLENRARDWVRSACASGEEVRDESEPLRRLRRMVRQRLRPQLALCRQEITHLLSALSGRFVPPGPAGAPTRGRLDVLPTGRNFFSVDPRTIPTPTAWRCGQRLGELLLERHRQDHGEYPRKVALVIWGTSNMRTGGDDVAQALWLWGCEPLWEQASGRLVDFHILPVALLGRPRVDVLLRVSGLFRDAFGETMRLLATVPKRLAQLDEPVELNPVRASFLRDRESLMRAGLPEPEAARRASLRVFSSGPGCYGTGLLPLLDAGIWETRADLARVFCRWGNHAYGTSGEAEERNDLLETRLREIEVVHQNQDNREHDILDSDDYFQFQGGLRAAVHALRGDPPAVYHGDSSRPEQPKMRTLREELVRVIRSRVLNPRWIEAMRRHGYKGAFEFAATVDYLFGYGVTTGLVSPHHYEEVARAVLLAPEQQAFFHQHNPEALQEAAERLLEAAERGVWRSPDPRTLADLESVVLEVGAQLE
ncbi:MAG: cobaltochelatase subunit CobN [Verrucomicrobia bacterium]|nr:cobaltochelatase subunit CobN [Verrucomicrobiota bacterium]